MSTLFALGQIVATPAALEALRESGQEPDEFLIRHGSGDWGDVPQEDRDCNNQAVKNGSWLLSAYVTKKDQRIYLITECDRSVTTLLLPSEY